LRNLGRFPRREVLEESLKEVSVKRESLMEELVIRLNIERYRKMLAQDDDRTKQGTLLQLLVEEEAKLAARRNLASR
jgi:hypothetical protein